MSSPDPTRVDEEVAWQVLCAARAALEPNPYSREDIIQWAWECYCLRHNDTGSTRPVGCYRKDFVAWAEMQIKMYGTR